jgi:ubiquitin-conjugating enzyme E2 D/E
MNIAIKRLTKEFTELNNFIGSRGDKFEASFDESNMLQWKVIMHCPSDAKNFANQQFETIIYFTDRYPFNPPKIQFTKRPSHPNIMSNGYVCVDILKHEWSPLLSATKLYVSVMSLLIDGH